MLNQQFAFDRPLRDKGRLNRDVKTLIANAAAGYVRDGDALILDSGSTTAQIVPFLKGRRDLVVMTNALNIAYELSGNDGVEVMVLGQRAPQLLLALRSGCRAAIASVPLRQAVLGVDGFDLSAGITTPHPGEAHLNRVMCEVAREIIAVADASKFGRKSFCMIREAGQIHRLITDSRLPDDYERALTELGVEVIIADR